MPETHSKSPVSSGSSVNFVCALSNAQKLGLSQKKEWRRKIKGSVFLHSSSSLKINTPPLSFCLTSKLRNKTWKCRESLTWFISWCFWGSRFKVAFLSTVSLIPRLDPYMPSAGSRCPNYKDTTTHSCSLINAPFCCGRKVVPRQMSDNNNVIGGRDTKWQNQTPPWTKFGTNSRISCPLMLNLIFRIFRSRHVTKNA